MSALKIVNSSTNKKVSFKQRHTLTAAMYMQSCIDPAHAITLAVSRSLAFPQKSIQIDWSAFLLDGQLITNWWHGREGARILKKFENSMTALGKRFCPICQLLHNAKQPLGQWAYNFFSSFEYYIYSWSHYLEKVNLPLLSADIRITYYFCMHNDRSLL